MATTVAEFTANLIDAVGENAKMHVELRTDGTRYWARATPSGLSGVGAGAKLGVVRLEIRERDLSQSSAWGSWVTKKSKNVVAGDGQVWTDESYNPPNSTSTLKFQVCAGYTGDIDSAENQHPRTTATNV